MASDGDEAQMTRWLIPAVSSILLNAAHDAAPQLSQTQFYTTTVHGCRDLDLSRWKHPVKQVLVHAGAKLAKVEVCNDDRFPVFTVTLPFDPEGQTDAYFDKLYADLAYANGFWSFALVDTSDDVIIVATSERQKRQVTLGYEKFSEPKPIP